MTHPATDPARTEPDAERDDVLTRATNLAHEGMRAASWEKAWMHVALACYATPGKHRFYRRASKRQRDAGVRFNAALASYERLVGGGEG